MREVRERVCVCVRGRREREKREVRERECVCERGKRERVCVC